MPKRAPPDELVERITVTLPASTVARLNYATGLRLAKRDPGHRGRFSRADLVAELLDKHLPDLPADIEEKT